MISKFSFENLLSFENRQEISFNHEHNSAKIFKNNTIFEYKENNKKRAILNGAIILGANASGKSNIIYALNQMKNYYIDSVKYDKESDTEIDINGFAFTESIDSPIKLDIEFIKFIQEDAYKINYGFSINGENKLIQEEYLSYTKILKSTTSNEIFIFKREGDNVESLTPETTKIINKIRQENIQYKLVLSLMNFDINRTFFQEEVSTVAFKITEACGLGFSEDLLLANDNKENLDPFIAEVDNNPEFKNYIISSLYDFDFALADFKVKDITDEFLTMVKSHGVLDQLSESARKEFMSNASKIKHYKIETIHKVNDKDYILPISVESDGTKKFLKHSLKIYESVLKGRVYISDEFDSHYHIHLQEGIINKYINAAYENKMAQFLIITHNPLLINPKFFAKEQVFFVEKDRSTESSSIYSLKDFSGVSYNNHSWTNLYLSGRMGAIPEVFS